MFTYLAFLACPLSMGAMMWWMMRGDRSGGGRAVSRDARIDQLQRELDALRREEGPLREADPGPVRIAP